MSLPTAGWGIFHRQRLGLTWTDSVCASLRFPDQVCAALGRLCLRHRLFIWHQHGITISSDGLSSRNRHIIGWWFQTFFIFHNIWDNPSHWLIFFKMVRTTNQIMTHKQQVGCWKSAALPFLRHARIGECTMARSLRCLRFENVGGIAINAELMNIDEHWWTRGSRGKSWPWLWRSKTIEPTEVPWPNSVPIGWPDQVSQAARFAIVSPLELSGTEQGV